MRGFISPLMMLIYCVCLTSVSATPLFIEIDEGIETVPFEVGDVDMRTSSSFVESIELTNESYKYQNLPQLIENTSGIQLRKYGGIGNFTTISIRGKSADQITVYLDGMVINNASGGSVDLSKIPLNNIARIDIYKDSIPVEFSETSNGGVINIITHRTTGNTTTLSGGIGSFQTKSLDLNTSIINNKWKYILNAGILRSENNFSYNFENNTFLNPYDDEIVERNNNQLSQYNILANAVLNINQHSNIQYQIESFKKDKNIPTIYNFDNIDVFTTDNNKNISFQYKNSQFNDNTSVNVAFKLGENISLFSDKNAAITFKPTEIKQRNIQTETKVFLKYLKNNYNLVLSNTFRTEKLTVTDLFEEIDTRQNSRQLFSSSLGLNYYTFNNKLIISPVIRAAYSSDKYNGETQTGSRFVANKDFTKQYQTISPQIGLRYNLTPNTDVKLNLSRQHRLPNYTELFGARGYIGGNDELEPEKGTNFDVGFTFNKLLRSDILRRINWDVALFHSTITKEIVYISNAQGISKPSNIGRSEITGLENNLQFEIGENIEIISNTTIQAPLNKSVRGQTRLLSGRSFWFQKSRIQISNDSIYYYFEHIAKSIYYLDTDNDIPNKRTLQLNLGLTINSKQNDLSLTINNLSDRRNKDFFFQPVSGRSIFLNLTHRFS